MRAILIFFTLLGTSSLYALDYKELKERAMALRNTDPQVSKPSEWEQVTKDLEIYTQTPSSEQCEALFTLGNLCSSFYQKRGDEKHYGCAVRAFGAVEKRYHNHNLAPEALLGLGDLYEIRGEDSDQIYNAILARYPASAAATIAKARLNGDLQLEAKEDEARASLKRSSNAKKVIVIDPGHGGDDHGAYSELGLLEKDIALDIARRMQSYMKGIAPVDVQLTREIDIFVPLTDRTDFANDLGADLFLSIHVNSSPSAQLSGVETYYLDNSADQATIKLAQRENGTEQTGSQSDLAFLLGDLVQSAKLAQSIAFASKLQAQLVTDLKARYSFVKDLGVKKGPFFVLTNAHMPCALVELFFVNNPEDAPYLADPKFREEIARSLARSSVEVIS